MERLGARFDRIAENLAEEVKGGISDKEYDAILFFGQAADRIYNDAYSFGYVIGEMNDDKGIAGTEFESARSEYSSKIMEMSNEVEKLAGDFWRAAGSSNGESGFEGDSPIDHEAIRKIAADIKAKSDVISRSVFAVYRLFSSVIAGKVIPEIIEKRQRMFSDVSQKFEENGFGENKYYKFLPEYYDVESLSDELKKWNGYYDLIVGDYSNTSSGEGPSPSVIIEAYNDLREAYVDFEKVI